MIQNERYWQARKVTLFGVMANCFLGVIKLIGGYFFYSHALIADGIHSLSDLISDFMVLFASKYGSIDADDSHPYGHQRIETVATLFLSILLIAAGLAILWDALRFIIEHEAQIPLWQSIPIITCSILLNEGLFHYTRFIGIKINSSLITANAWHHRADAASSLVVLIGIIGSMLGFVLLDAIAAIIVGVMVIKVGGAYVWHSLRELVDTGVNHELLKQIENTITQVDGVIKIHQLRSRFMSNDVLIDVHIIVSPKISVSEGHYIAQHVHHALVNSVENVKDVVVHVDHEDDELCSPSLHLPSRKVIQEQLLNQVHIDFPQILYWNVHYLDGALSIDIFCNETFNQWQMLHQRVILALQLQTNIKEIRLFSLHETVQGQ